MLKIALKTLIILVFLTSCEALKPKKVDKSVPVNAQDRARKAVDEGRGISLEGLVVVEKALTMNSVHQILCGERL